MGLKKFFKSAIRPNSSDVRNIPVPSANNPAGLKPLPVDRVSPHAAKSPEPQPTVDQAIEMFTAIQEIIGADADVVRIPADKLLSGIAVALRGPEWSDQTLPSQNIDLDRAPLLAQLKKGRVSYPISDLAATLPLGWLRLDADTMIELPLPAVVAAMSPQDLCGTNRLDDEVLAATSMRDYFQKPSLEPDLAPPSIEVESTPTLAVTGYPSPESAAQPATVTADVVLAAPLEVDTIPVAELQPPAQISEVTLPSLELPESPISTMAVTTPDVSLSTQIITEPLLPKAVGEGEVTGWDGVERQMDAGANVSDLNTVDAENLESLPGVGTFRAQLILEYRRQHGPFSSIYDLLRIPGIGRRLFRQITGLRPIRKNRRDRHEVLNTLLGLPVEDRPTLGQLMQTVVEVLEATGSILSGQDGVLLAQFGLDSQTADRYAAFTPNYFRKTRRYWPLLGVDGVQQVLLPGAHPQALLIHGNAFAWILLMPDGKDWNVLIGRSKAIAEEINWLFSPHAVVRRIASDSHCE